MSTHTNLCYCWKCRENKEGNQVMTNYLDKEIVRLNAKIEALEAEKAKYQGEYTEFIVGMSENNSGGSFWLKDKDYTALVGIGWTAERSTWQHAASKTFLARSEDEAINMAKADFENVTDQLADAIGCTCCGRPFNFDIGPWWLEVDED